MKKKFKVGDFLRHVNEPLSLISLRRNQDDLLVKPCLLDFLTAKDLNGSYLDPNRSSICSQDNAIFYDSLSYTLDKYSGLDRNNYEVILDSLDYFKIRRKEGVERRLSFARVSRFLEKEQDKYDIFLEVAEKLEQNIVSSVVFENYSAVLKSCGKLGLKNLKPAKYEFNGIFKDLLN